MKKDYVSPLMEATQLNSMNVLMVSGSGGAGEPLPGRKDPWEKKY